VRSPEVLQAALAESWVLQTCASVFKNAVAVKVCLG
jgi:hypothetical protein